jgi:hypothetical protein
VTSTASTTTWQVTNTPWGERVTFVFDPHNEGNVDIKKSLHVSPFMDMTSTWSVICCYGLCRLKNGLFATGAHTLCAHWHVFVHRQLEAPDPGQGLKLVVRVEHKEYGQFFYAELVRDACWPGR